MNTAQRMSLQLQLLEIYDTDSRRDDGFIRDLGTGRDGLVDNGRTFLGGGAFGNDDEWILGRPTST